MDQIFLIFIFFSILFLIETKAINLLICFVGIILTLALKLANINSLTFFEGEYISYILILVQVSALTILFGFLIMLYPTLPIQTSNVKENYIKENYVKENNFKFASKFVILVLSLFTLFLALKNFPFLISFGNKLFPEGLSKFLIITPQTSSFFEENISNKDTKFLRDLGYYLYTNDNNIFKLIILTIILLLAILALFFLIS